MFYFMKKKGSILKKNFIFKLKESTGAKKSGLHISGQQKPIYLLIDAGIQCMKFANFIIKKLLTVNKRKWLNALFV